MPLFRFLLIVMGACVLSYTIVIVRTYGLNPLPAFVGDIVAQIWSGQMHLALACVLLLMASWVVWRHRFSAVGIAAALATLVGGILFIAPYLLALTFSSKGDMESLLLGERRARAEDGG